MIPHSCAQHQLLIGLAILLFVKHLPQTRWPDQGQRAAVQWVQAGPQADGGSNVRLNN